MGTHAMVTMGRAVEHAAEPPAQPQSKRQGEREQGCAREEKACDGQ